MATPEEIRAEQAAERAERKAQREAEKAEREAAKAAQKELDEAESEAAKALGAYAKEIWASQDRARKAKQGHADGSLTKLTNQTAQERFQTESAQLRARQVRAGNGQYRDELTAAEKVRREREATERVERRIQLQHKYGERIGGAVERIGGAATTAGRVGLGVAEGTLAAGAGAVYKGFGQSTEWAQLQYQLDLTTFKFAGAFKPALDFATDKVQSFGGFLDKMSPGQQRLVMWTGLAAAGAFGLNAALKRTVGVGLGAVAMGAGSLVSRAGASVAAQYAAGGVGGMVGNVAAGAAGATGITKAGLLRYGPYAAVALAATAGYANASTDDMDPLVRTHLKAHPELANESEESLRRMAAEANRGESGFRNVWRRTADRTVSGLMSGAKGFFGMKNLQDDWRPESDQLESLADARKAKDQLTRNETGLGDVGSSYDRFAEGVLTTMPKQDQKSFEAGSPDDVQQKMLVALELIQLTLENNGRGGPPALPDRGR